MRVNPAAEGLQKRTEMMDKWQHEEVQVKESGWAEEVSQRWKQPKGENRTEMKTEAKLLRFFEVLLAKWISVEYREEVQERIQRKVRYLLWDTAQMEEGGNGATVQPRGHGRMEVCSECSEKY